MSFLRTQVTGYSGAATAHEEGQHASYSTKVLGLGSGERTLREASETLTQFQAAGGSLLEVLMAKHRLNRDCF